MSYRKDVGGSDSVLPSIFRCLFGFCRYLSTWVDDYRENLQNFFVELKSVLPKEALVIWNLTMPLGDKIQGGFLLPEVHHCLLFVA